MISFEEALARMLSSIERMPQIELPLGKIRGHVLASNITAQFDAPPFDNSAVDGYGVRLQDVEGASDQSPVKLALKGTIRAGDSGALKLPAKAALQILTGACVPPTVEAVVMQEYCTREGDNVLIKRAAVAGENIRRRGGEFLRGQMVLSHGRLVTPSMVGLIANLGYSKFPVYRRPRAAVVTTGNELTKPGRPLMPGMIYDSNSFGMVAALQEFGLEECLHFHAAEDKTSTKRVLARALAYADVVVSTGGVSVGEFDHVKSAMEELGVKTQIWRIAIKPGKPVYFGVFYDSARRRNKYVFGLPGNPVSALVTYHQLVKPCLAKLIGVSSGASTMRLTATLSETVYKRAGRLEFLRGVLSNTGDKLFVSPVSGQDSHMLGGLAAANALIHFPLEAEILGQGHEVTVDILNWSP